MTSPRIRVRVPESASRDELITIKTMISHPMENGRRKMPDTGEIIPKKIINIFIAQFDEEEVFRTELSTAISENPYIAFQMRVIKSGTLELIWDEDGGETYRQSAYISIRD